MGRRSAIGFYFFRAATGDILLTGNPADTTFEVHGPETGTLETNCISMAFGRRLSSNVLVGASAKIIRTHLIDAYAAGGGFDLALSVHFPDARTIFTGVSSAAVIRDLGTTLSWSTGRTEPLTPTLTIGLAYRPWTPDRILVSADMEKPLKPSHSGVRWRFGVEFLLGQIVPLRFGYEEQSISTGAGFKSDHIRLDYAFSFHRELAGSHRVSLTLAR